MGILRTYPLEQVFACFFEDFTVKVGSALSVTRSASANFTRYARQTTGAINNETFCTFTLTPGDYTFTFLYGTSPSSGIATVKINGATVAAIDAYTSGTVLATSQTFTYTVTNYSPHTLSIVMASKNAASTNYDFLLTRVSAKLT